MAFLLYCEIGNKVFRNPLDLIGTNKLSEVAACFDRLESASQQGYYLAGFLSYEAGYAFEPRLQGKDEFDFPLLKFGIFREPRISKTLPVNPDLRISGELTMAADQYGAKIEKIREYIAAGDTYQITFCVKQKFGYAGSPYQLYQSLLSYQAVPYPAFISHDDLFIISLSPEMFLHKKGGIITTKPMKGTLLRDGRIINDLFGGWQLHYDPKNRAENIMITDLLRNDLGRICHYGSVRTLKLYEVAKYRTVYQMTSTVQGELNDPAIRYYDIFKALFPSGSVTGAPKIRAMEIIRELEPEERRIYTGAIGYITPDREMFFNIPIRTLLFRDRQGKQGVAGSSREGEMGVGGGITWYSTAEGEYEECLIKSRFLSAPL